MAFVYIVSGAPDGTNKYSTCRVRLATQDISRFSVPMQFTFHCHNWVSGGRGKGYPSISGDVYFLVLQ